MNHAIILEKKMNTVYINEFGVRPWTSIHPTINKQFITLTLLDHDFDSVWESWCKVMDALSEEWPIKKQWRSLQTLETNSITQAYLLNKDMKKMANDWDIFKRNEKSKIYSAIKNHPSDPRTINNLPITGSRDTLLVIQKSEAPIEELWSAMTIFEKDISPEKMSVFLEYQANTLLCQFYDDAETHAHAAAQFIYQTCRENKNILEKIKSFFPSISVTDVHHYINETKKHERTDPEQKNCWENKYRERSHQTQHPQKAQPS